MCAALAKDEDASRSILASCAGAAAGRGCASSGSSLTTESASLSGSSHSAAMRMSVPAPQQPSCSVSDACVRCALARYVTRPTAGTLLRSLHGKQGGERARWRGHAP